MQIGITSIDGEQFVMVSLVEPRVSNAANEWFPPEFAKQYGLMLIQLADLLDANKQDEETK